MFWYTVHATTVVLVFIWGEGGRGGWGGTAIYGLL